MNAEEKAHLLIQEITKALRNGTRHYSMNGRLLPTVKAVLEELRDSGQIVFEPKGTEDGPSPRK